MEAVASLCPGRHARRRLLVPGSTAIGAQEEADWIWSGTGSRQGDVEYLHTGRVGRRARRRQGHDDLAEPSGRWANGRRDRGGAAAQDLIPVLPAIGRLKGAT